MDRVVLTVAEEADGERADQFLAENVDYMTRSAVARLLTGNAAVSGGRILKKSSIVHTDDEVVFEIPDAVKLDVEPEDIPLDIYYEDDDLLVVYKPKGMVVHPAPGNYTGTLVNALLYHCGDSLSGINGVLRPGIVHRIDKDTSGLLLVAKNDMAHTSLAAQLKEHSITRVYQAVVYGTNLQDEGEIDAPIGRSLKDRKKMAVVNDGRPAQTGYSVVKRYRGFTHIECKLKTGRTHQIRVHMAYIGHPVAGDQIYGPTKVITALHGQCLHAGKLGFVHPRTGEYMEFSAGLPAYFTDFLSTLEEM